MPPLPNICPSSIASDQFVTLAHGEGGRAARRLIEERIVPRLKSTVAGELTDAATLPPLAGQPVMTTDSYVVSPIFFPGGDIGKLAVYGTANDLAVSGARPLWASLALILEEGLSMATLEQVLDSIAAAAESTGVQVVTGDTKVVPRGAADGIFVTTTGLGQLLNRAPAGPQSLQSGDRIIASGPIGRHGMAILAAREGLGFDPLPTSDCGSLWPAVKALHDAGCQVRAMRDATRGGAAGVLQEWAAACQRTMAIDEAAIPLAAEVRGACELLGLDPLHLANEGTMLVAASPEEESQVLETLRGAGGCAEATVIGQVVARSSVPVFVRRGRGVEIPLEEPQGMPLPRIC
ncbi:hydrogenase expression/formation protein HypE [Blastopirellula marina]|uniref:Hydrogenase expression/formation protein HypE n=1 Tax=Blastopirellula marina TaxID=124 RepID=A0A2S8GHL4_9BACT|nr:hydrogenase expression/formation protein HypE [Blastopirellula marina]PQO43935.1 hydrogenase expression/formation protein HypE [Blastopirellula marina]